MLQPKQRTASDAAAASLPSPPKTSITLPTLARLIVWPIQKRRVSAPTIDGAVSASEPLTPPPSPPSQPQSTFKIPVSPRSKAQFLECSSGVEAKTHDTIVDSNPACRNAAIVMYKDFFECRDAVDVKRLLRLSRGKVMERVEKLGGNTIVHEKWSCSITRHPNKQTTMYRVSIIYEGTPARSDIPDPGQPIALDQIKGVPGLMTVVSRQSRYEGPCTKHDA